MLVVLALTCPGLVHQVDRSELLSGPLTAFLASGDVEAFDVSPDGTWVLYRAPQGSSTPGLYAVLTDGSREAVPVSAPGASVGAFQIDPTGSRAVFLSGPDLYRLDPAGSVTRLNAALPAGAAVLDFVLGPDGTRALYRADQEVAGRVDLYSVNLVGRPHGVRVSRVGPAGGDVSHLLLARGGQRVVFVGDLVVDQRDELFSAPLDGSQPDVALCGSFVAGGGLNGFTLVPRSDESRVAYIADQLVNDRFVLFSVPLDASSAPVRLNGNLPAFGDVLDLQLAAAGGLVAFTADTLVDHRPELYSAPVDGSAPAVKLNALATPVTGYVMAPSGATVAFVDQYCGGLSNQLWSVPADGSAPPTPLGNHPANQHCISQLAITPDSKAAFYLLTFGSGRRLFRVLLEGGAAPLEIVPPLQTDVLAYRLGADGLRLALLLEYEGTSARVLASTTADGSARALALHASGPLRAGPREDFELTDGHLVFRADLKRRDVFELQRVPLDGSSPARCLNEGLFVSPVVTDVTSFALAPDGTRLGYTTGLGAYSVQLFPRLMRTLDRAFAPPEGSYFAMRVSPDGSRLFWLGPGAGTHLFSAPFDASNPTVQVSRGAFAFGFGATDARFSPDGSRFTFAYSTYDGPGSTYAGPTDLATPPVFLSRATIQGLTYLGSEVVFALSPYNPFYPEPTSFLRRPVDLSGPAVELVPTPSHFPPPSGRIAVTPDGTRVLFVRDEQTPGKRELHSLLLTPGAQPVRLDDALGADRGVLYGVYPTPDSTRVLYAADRDANEVYELYVVPVDGSQAPLELSGTLVSGGDVTNLSNPSWTSVWITPDSTRAVYAADALVDNRADLYSVPLDGSAPPTLLVQGRPNGIGVFTEAGAVQLSADGARLYVRGTFGTTLNALASVPVAGGPLVLIGSSPIPGADVSLPYVVLPDGRVVYRMDLAVDERFELWIAPGDRPGLSQRQSFLGHAGGDVEPQFAVDPSGTWVYYRADARAEGEIELFRHPLDPTPRAKQR